jgi:hypothetical protein
MRPGRGVHAFVWTNKPPAPTGDACVRTGEIMNERCRMSRAGALRRHRGEPIRTRTYRRETENIPMNTAHIVVTIVAAAWVGFSAVSLLRRAAFVVDPLVEYGVPKSWWTPLGLAKAAGALGLIGGLFVPAVGVAAAIGLILYFAGAVITVLRARSYQTVAFPMLYLIPVAVALGLGFAA